MITNLTRLTNSLDRIGHANSTSQDPADNAAHEFSVAGFLRNYAEKRYDKAKSDLVNVIGDVGIAKLDESKKLVKKLGVTSNVVVALAQLHVINAQIKRGASFLDETALMAELVDLLGQETTSKLFTKHRKQRDPSVTFIITENEE